MRLRCRRLRKLQVYLNLWDMNLGIEKSKQKKAEIKTHKLKKIKSNLKFSCLKMHANPAKFPELNWIESNNPQLEKEWLWFYRRKWWLWRGKQNVNCGCCGHAIASLSWRSSTLLCPFRWRCETTNVTLDYHEPCLCVSDPPPPTSIHAFPYPYNPSLHSDRRIVKKNTKQNKTKKRKRRGVKILNC